MSGRLAAVAAIETGTASWILHLLRHDLVLFFKNRMSLMPCLLLFSKANNRSLNIQHELVKTGMLFHKERIPVHLIAVTVRSSHSCGLPMLLQPQ